MGDWDLKSHRQVDLEDAVDSLKYQLSQRDRELQYLRWFITGDHKVMAKFAQFVLNGRNVETTEKEAK